MVEKLCTPLFGKVVCVDKNNSYEKLKDIDILSIHRFKSYYISK